MTPPMTCERFEDRLADLLERDVDETTRAELEAHAIACGSCGPLLADVRNLRIDAANLPDLAPSRDLWTGIADRIATPVIELTGHAPHAPRSGIQRISRSVWSGLAAAGLVIATAGITHVLTKRSIASQQPTRVVQNPSQTPTQTPTLTQTPTQTPTQTLTPTQTPTATLAQTPAPATIEQVNNPPAAAATTYDREIARLRTVLNQRRARLDPQTVGVIELNLRVIDDAIAQCRAALQKDPASQFLMQSLNDELENKIELLRRAALLPIRSS